MIKLYADVLLLSTGWYETDASSPRTHLTAELKWEVDGSSVITSRHWCGKSDGWTETVEKTATRHEYMRAPRVALFD